MLRILFLGDVIGEPGRKAVNESVRRFKEERQVDFVIVNGENAAAGRGITPKISIDLLRSGVAVNRARVVPDQERGRERAHEGNGKHGGYARLR